MVAEFSIFFWAILRCYQYQHYMTISNGGMMNNDLERIRKEAVIA
jgi:hypothetical protein